MKSCEPVRDGFKLIEPHIGGVEFLDQLGDQLLETAERGMSAARKLSPFDLVDQCLDQVLEFGGAFLARSIEQHYRDAGDVVAQPVCGHVEAGGQLRAGGDGSLVAGIGSWTCEQPRLEALLPG